MVPSENRDYQTPAYEFVFSSPILPVEHLGRMKPGKQIALPDTLYVTMQAPFLPDVLQNRSVDIITATKPGCYPEFYDPIVAFMKVGESPTPVQGH